MYYREDSTLCVNIGRFIEEAEESSCVYYLKNVEGVE
jgi:hypothetical protein